MASSFSCDRITRVAYALAALLLAIGFASRDAPLSPPPRVQAFGGATMGSSYEVKFVADIDLATVCALVEAELAAFDATFSQWRPDSELARVNAHASTQPLPVSARFAAVLQLALDVAAATEGAFDPTVKPLSDLYRAAKRDPQHRLDAVALAAAKQRVNHAFVALRHGAVVKTRTDVTLDLDGLAAGAACDAIAMRLESIGVHAFYVQVTGEVVCRGEKRPGEPWRIGIADPIADATGATSVIRTLPLRDQALCTSGDYRNAFLAHGVVHSHVWDPRTGESARGEVISASVLANTAALADALGTAFLVLGETDTKRLWPSLQRLGASGVLLLLPTDAGLRHVEIAWPNDDG